MTTRPAAAIAALAFGLAACATPPAPRPELVQVPVAVPCLPPELPDAPPTTPTGAFNVMTRGEVASILAEEWLAYSAWIARARPYLEACRVKP